MIMHVHPKSDLSEGSDEFAHFARIQKVLPEGVRLWERFFFFFFFLVDEGRDCRTNDGQTFNAGLVTLWFFQEIHTSIARKPYSFVIFQGGGSRPHGPPSGSAHAHTHSLARAFTACLLKVVDIQVRKLSTPSPKDVDCIPCELYSLQEFE